eukprot:TRINITY_DN2229_c0_g1_i16.p1 TRINITY_DN2229_c0_g1~~TRINITY_DN2229_c0_g1_i16.p1  ORF type:complete len:154 (-),score=16.38 TRINITY_DN2229_c0_g1_i16:1767-2228(-)
MSLIRKQCLEHCSCTMTFLKMHPQCNGSYFWHCSAGSNCYFAANLCLKLCSAHKTDELNSLVLHSDRSRKLAAADGVGGSGGSGVAGVSYDNTGSQPKKERRTAAAAAAALRMEKAGFVPGAQALEGSDKGSDGHGVAAETEVGSVLRPTAGG